MKLYVVHKPIGGYAREDAAESYVVAAVEDAELANKIKLWSHGSIAEVEVNAVPEGFKQFRREVFGEA